MMNMIVNDATSFVARGLLKAVATEAAIVVKRGVEGAKIGQKGT